MGYSRSAYGFERRKLRIDRDWLFVDNITVAKEEKKLLVDQEKCIGCGTCVALCPEVFELNDEGKAKIRVKGQGSRVKGQIQNAIESCPVEAIKWE